MGAPTASPTAAPTVPVTASPTVGATASPTESEIESEELSEIFSEDTEDMPDTEEESEGSWHLVFRQTFPFKFSKADNWAQAKSYNADDDTADNFSILGDLENFRSSEDDKFTLKLQYPESRLHGREVNVWKQTTNPVTATKGGVEGYESINTPWTAKHWGGLEKNGRVSLLDGSVNKRWWYYAIGSARTWKGGYPSVVRSDKKVELYAFY